MANVPYERESAATHATNLIAWALALSQKTAGRVTDYNRGGIARTMLETVAIRLEHIDAKMFGGLRRAIPTGLYEFFGPGDGITSLVGFPALPALPANGIVRFQRRPGITGPLEVPDDAILSVRPEGTTDAEKLYRVIVPATMAADAAFVDTIAQAVAIGVAGNTPANTMTLKNIAGDPSQTGLFLGATNPAPFLSGQEAESSEQRRLRFTGYIRNLARAQHRGIEVAALQAQIVVGSAVGEHVLFAFSRDVPEKRGLVEVIIDNGGGTATPGLIAAAQQLIDGSFAPDGTPIPGSKAAGIVVNVRAVVPQIVDVTCAILLTPGYVLSPVLEAVTAAIQAYLFDLGVFNNLIHAGLSAAIKNVAGVADVTIATPTTNVVATAGARILPGAIVIAEMAALAA